MVHDMGMGTAMAQAQHDHGSPQGADERRHLRIWQLAARVIAAIEPRLASIGGAVIAATEVFVEELIKLAGTTSPAAYRSPMPSHAMVVSVGRDDRGLFESYKSTSRSGRDELVCQVEAPPPAWMRVLSGAPTAPAL